MYVDMIERSTTMVIFFSRGSFFRSRRHDSMPAAAAPTDDEFFRGMYLRPRRQDSVPATTGVSEVGDDH